MAALTFGNIAAGTEGFYQGRALSRKDETERIALEQLRRQEQINQELSQLPVEELPSAGKLAIGQGPAEVPVPVQEVKPDAAKQPSAQTRQMVEQQVASIPYGQEVTNPNFNKARFDQSQSYIKSETARIAALEAAASKFVVAPNMPPQQQAGVNQARLSILKQIDQAKQNIARAQQESITYGPTVDYGREGRSRVMQQATPEGQAATATTQYDTVKTPYDGLMEQAARENGIDPVIFKRLIGTESSFNPAAINNVNGQPVAFGIAQIYRTHIQQGLISQADAMNPTTAIPYAAKLFAAYLREAGGNYEQALYRYKGATSEQGRASVASPIATILAGVAAPAVATPAAAPAVATAPTAAPAGTQLAAAPGAAMTDTGISPTATAVNTAVQQQAAGVQVTKPVNAVDEIVKPSKRYLANPESISADMQQVLGTRQELVNLARIYQRAGAGKELLLIREQIRQLDNGLYQLQGMQGLAEFTPTFGYDSRRLSAVWSHYARVPVAVQPRSDGRFNLFVNGEVAEQGLTAKDISERARLTFDSAYRQSQSQTQAAMNMKAYESMLEIQKGNASEMAKMIREIAVGQQKGNYDLALETLKQNKFEVKPVGTEGIVIINPPFGGTPYLFNPAGQTLEIDGVKVNSKAAVPITGLPTVVQQQIMSKAR